MGTLRKMRTFKNFPLIVSLHVARTFYLHDWVVVDCCCVVSTVGGSLVAAGSVAGGWVVVVVVVDMGKVVGSEITNLCLKRWYT